MERHLPHNVPPSNESSSTEDPVTASEGNTLDSAGVIFSNPRDSVYDETSGIAYDHEIGFHMGGKIVSVDSVDLRPKVRRVGSINKENMIDELLMTTRLTPKRFHL